MRVKKKDAPLKLKPFIELGFDAHEDRMLGDEAYGDCTFCGTKNKLYINFNNGLWSCKSGKCNKSGNITTFFNEWYKQALKDRNPKDPHWEELAEERGIPKEALLKEGLVWDYYWDFIPVKTPTGSIFTFFKYHKELEHATQNMCYPPCLFGMEQLCSEENEGKEVYICEGAWDAIALRELFRQEKYEDKAFVIAAPSSGTWKDSWNANLLGRNVVACYDHDAAGRIGTAKLFKSLMRGKSRAKRFRHIAWNYELEKDGFDVRDFFRIGGKLPLLQSMIADYQDLEEKTIEQSSDPGALKARPPLAERKITFNNVLDVFKKHLSMNEDLIIGLKIICATNLIQPIQGSPVWIFIVAPPGSGKSMLDSLAGCHSCVLASSLTAKTLVSGFEIKEGKEDPSLLPRLFGKTFVLKDFTEILAMQKGTQEELFSTLRGAFDGTLARNYGNGEYRKYEGKFNMISGVTQAIYSRSSASLGARELHFHMIKDVNPHGTDPIKAAIRKLTIQDSIDQELMKVMGEFLDVRISSEDFDQLSEKDEDRIEALATVISILRATVDRVYQSGTHVITHRPQTEMGTRPAIQLTKLAYGLCLVDCKRKIDAEVYNILKRVTLDSCIGFRVDIVKFLMENEGASIEQISAGTNIPISTLRDHFIDMEWLGAIRRVKVDNEHSTGAPKFNYFPSENLKKHWSVAELSGGQVSPPIAVPIPEVKVELNGHKPVVKKFSFARKKYDAED